jgi:hypothetical protein
LFHVEHRKRRFRGEKKGATEELGGTELRGEKKGFRRCVEGQVQTQDK